MSVLILKRKVWKAPETLGSQRLVCSLHMDQNSSTGVFWTMSLHYWITRNFHLRTRGEGERKRERAVKVGVPVIGCMLHLFVELVGYCTYNSSIIGRGHLCVPLLDFFVVGKMGIAWAWWPCYQLKKAS